MSNQVPNEPDELRRRAEKSLADRQEEVPPTVSETDALALLRELHVSRIELEAHKREFYQRTILAATDGKLVIEERDAIRATAGSSLADWAVDSASGLARIREEAVALAGSLGMDQLGIMRLATCIGEATSNALKHAGGGKASLHRLQDSLLFEVEDHGPGIGMLSIPHVALSPGYSTAGTLGMGYKLMIVSASKVYLATGPDGTTVACEIGLRNDEPGDRPEVI